MSEWRQTKTVWITNVGRAETNWGPVQNILSQTVPLLNCLTVCPGTCQHILTGTQTVEAKRQPWIRVRVVSIWSHIESKHQRPLSPSGERESWPPAFLFLNRLHQTASRLPWARVYLRFLKRKFLFATVASCLQDLLCLCNQYHKE